tara:strand:- start:6078 stop:6485 length:408 start_codon:yes stop_codon:yes gene_type:complete
MNQEKLYRSIFSLNKIALVGMSTNESRPSHQIGFYLKEQGYNIYPVNPNYDKINELKCFFNLNEIKDNIDIVNIFRHPDYVLPIVNDSIKINPKVIWFQDGVVNYEAIDLANKNGILTIVDDCIYRRHKVFINKT